MICRPAENSYQRGRRALSEGRYKEAQAYFESALKIAQEMGQGLVQPSYLSFYALCLARQLHLLSESQEMCERAARSESYNADLWLNLAHVCVIRGDRAGAYAAIHRGLQLQPEHDEIVALVRQIGARRPPIVPFLSRDNPINKIAGRMRRRPQ